jgi:hypothetical protein
LENEWRPFFKFVLYSLSKFNTNNACSLALEVIAWFNNQPLHAVAITLATVHNGLLKAVLGSNYSLTTINHPLPRTTKDTIDDLNR